MAPLKLYLITASTEDGENLDQLVQAATPERAVELWRASGWLENADLDMDIAYAGAIVAQQDMRCAGMEFDYALRIYEVRRSRSEGVLNWCSALHNAPAQFQRDGGEAVLLGYVYR